ncbi:COP9 signalosome complex subunit 5b [Hordeum vulgare]|nr:COP9 signalosome complex subunit 5b [Hordeum vulgare]
MDAIYRYDEAANARAHEEKPSATDPHHFRRARISALTLLKMVVHARAGGTIEIMGLMQGKFQVDSIIVMDAFALPVEGTETRVNAQADAYEYMVEYSTINNQFQEPFLAIVIDPTRTVFAGKVDIGAFRTYPKDYKPPDEPVSEYQTIPLNKIEDFGVLVSDLTLTTNLSPL